MAYTLDDSVLDDGLSQLANGNALHLCPSLPTDRANVLSITLGNKPTPTINAPSDYGNPNGRQVIVNAITDGDVTETGTCSHWAIISGTLLLAAQTIVTPTAVTAGHKFTLDELFVAIPTT